jgi:hypothetical protein
VLDYLQPEKAGKQQGEADQYEAAGNGHAAIELFQAVLWAIEFHAGSPYSAQHLNGAVVISFHRPILR